MYGTESAVSISKSALVTLIASAIGLTLCLGLPSVWASPGKFALGTAMSSGDDPQIVQMKFNWEPSIGASRHL